VLEPHVHVHAGHQRGEHVGEDAGVTVLLPAAADVVAAVAAGDRAVVGELELGVLRPGPGALRRAGRLRAAAGGQQRQQARGEQAGDPADGAHGLGSPPRGPGSQTIMAHPATTRCPTTTAGTTPGAPGPPATEALFAVGGTPGVPPTARSASNDAGSRVWAWPRGAMMRAGRRGGSRRAHDGAGEGH